MAVLIAAVGFANPFRLRHIPLLGPPAPVKKWEFTTMTSIVQDCEKPGDLLYNFSTHKCDPRIPASLPEHSPAIDSDGTIYVGGANRAYALNADGTEKWFYEVPAQVSYAPTLYTFLDDNGNIWFDFQSTYGTAGLYRVDASGRGDAIVSASHVITQAGLLQDGTIFALWDRTAPVFLAPGSI